MFDYEKGQDVYLNMKNMNTPIMAIRTIKDKLRNGKMYKITGFDIINDETGVYVEGEFYNDEFKLYYSSFSYDELINKDQSSDYGICGTARISQRMLSEEAVIQTKLYKTKRNTSALNYILHRTFNLVFIDVWC